MIATLLCLLATLSLAAARENPFCMLMQVLGGSTKQAREAPSNIRDVCKNSTSPYRNADGVIPNATACADLHCPKGYKCEHAQDNPCILESNYVVCCDQAYSEHFDDFEKCPNHDDPLTNENGVIVRAKSCEKINKICAFHSDENVTYACMHSRQTAKCCPNSWQKFGHKHCPIGLPYRKKNASKDRTCGTFFRTKLDDENCPVGHRCFERENRSYCCEDPPEFALNLGTILGDVFDPVCRNATADVGQCFGEFGFNSSSDTLGALNITTSDLMKMPNKFAKLKITTTIGEHVQNVSNLINITRSALFNFTSLQREELRAKCANYSALRACLGNVSYTGKLNSTCVLSTLVRNISTTVLDIVCNENQFDELLDSLQCLLNMTDDEEEGEKAMHKCAKEMADDMSENIGFGVEYVLATMCSSLKGFFGCLRPPMMKACGANGGKHAMFLQAFFSKILTVVFGRC